MAPTTSDMVWPARSTRALPASTRETLLWISCLISLAASAERPARLRTSAATTAKPRPCSPARAASTAAFSARMLVWKAMPSMTPMMSAILWLLSVMLRMLSTTSPTTSPPCWATCEALRASWLACRALSAFWRTVDESCSIEAAVSSSALACSSVREDRSVVPLEISSLAVATDSALLRTRCTTVLRLWRICSMVAIRVPISSLLRAWMGWVRSPAAICVAACIAWWAGRDSERVTSTANSSARAALLAMLPSTHHMAEVLTVALSVRSTSALFWLMLDSLPTVSARAAKAGSPSWVYMDCNCTRAAGSVLPLRCRVNAASVKRWCTAR